MNHSWTADQFLTRGFDTPIRLYLYGRSLDLRNTKTEYRSVHGIDSRGKHQRLHKNDILFAFPFENVLDVKPHIKKRQTSESGTKTQPKVDERALRRAVKKDIFLIMRAGYVIYGKLQAFDKHHLFMHVGNKEVLVYRHGLFKLEKETVPNQTEGNARNEVRKKKHPKWVEANRPKKEKIPSQTKTNDLHELRKDPEERVKTSRLKKEAVPNQTEGNDRNETRKKRHPEGDEAETMAEIAKAWRGEGKSPEEMLDRISTEKRRAERLIIELSDAEEKQYEIRARNIRATLSTIDPHTPLREQYTKFNNMECQMCRQDMPFKKRNSNDDYFEAVEAFGKNYFPKEHEAQYLALCPECAAKYKEFVKRDPVARKYLYNLLKDSDNPEVRLELSDCVIRIWFDEKHWHDLKTVLHYYENVYDTENSTD